MIVTRARAGRILDLGQFVCWAYGAQRVVQATGRALHALESGADGWTVLSRSADGYALATELCQLGAGGSIRIRTWSGAFLRHFGWKVPHG